MAVMSLVSTEPGMGLARARKILSLKSVGGAHVSFAVGLRFRVMTCIYLGPKSR